MKSQLIGRYSRLGFWFAGTAASQPGAGFRDPWELVWISTGAFLSNPGAGAMKKKKKKKKMYLRNYIHSQGEAVCISVFGFRWYSTERSGFDCFDHGSFDCDCMRRLWNYGMENYLILGSSLSLCWSTGDRSLRCTLLHPCVLWSWGTDINDFNWEYLCVCMWICRWKWHSVYSCCLA